MTTTPFREPAALRGWCRYGWPALAGTVGAVGLASAMAVVGSAPLFSVFVTLSVFSGVLTWSFVRETSGRHVSPWRVAAWTPFVVLVLMGWMLLTPLYGFTICVLTALASPALIRFVRASRRRARARGMARLRSYHRVLMDREMVDRRFAEIVRQLQQSDERQDR